jgi:hypothetical protein
MSGDDIILLVLLIAFLGAAGWTLWRDSTPIWKRTAEQRAAQERAMREDTFFLCAGDQMIETTARTGRKTTL